MRAAEEASRWLLRLEYERTEEAHAQFDSWIRQGALNVEEFLHAKANWVELDALDDSFAVEAPVAQADIVRFPPASRARAGSLSEAGVRASSRGWKISLAAGIAVLALTAAAVVYRSVGVDSYSTDIGSQQTLRLADGSVIQLNTSSRVEARFDEHRRELRLLQGEALFTVAHDARRPFYVLTDTARVQALGTQFNVRLDRAVTRVAVVDGAVQVAIAKAATAAGTRSAAPVQLGAGDEAEVSRTLVVKAQAPNVERAVAWRVRQLMFERARIAEIAGEFNRYNSVPIVIEDETLGSRRMGGTYDADDAGPWLRFLSSNLDAEVVRSESRIIVRAKTKTE